MFSRQASSLLASKEQIIYKVKKYVLSIRRAEQLLSFGMAGVVAACTRNV